MLLFQSAEQYIMDDEVFLLMAHATRDSAKLVFMIQFISQEGQHCIFGTFESVERI